MRKYIAVMLCICTMHSIAQNRVTDSLRQLVNQSKEDTSRVRLLNDLAFSYFNFHLDSCNYYNNQALQLARNLNDRKGEAICLSLLGLTVGYMGNYPRALGISLKSLKLAESVEDRGATWNALNALGIIYDFQKDYGRSIDYNFKALNVAMALKDDPMITRSLTDIGDDYYYEGRMDSALYYTRLAYLRPRIANHKTVVTDQLNNLGSIYDKLNKNSLALDYYRLALPIEIELEDLDDFCVSTLGMAAIFQKQNKYDSALIYGYRSMNAAVSNNFNLHLMRASSFIASVYESKKNTDSAFKYLKLTISINDSLFSQERSKSMQNMTSEENTRQIELSEQRKKEAEDAIKSLQLTAIAVFIPVFFLFVLFLSKTKVKARVVEFLAVVGLLLSFEFITDLIFPYISDWTNDSPLWETLILLILAALIEPLNYKLERWVKGHLVHKQIHMAAH